MNRVLSIPIVEYCYVCTHVAEVITGIPLNCVLRGMHERIYGSSHRENILIDTTVWQEITHGKSENAENEVKMPRM